MIESEEVMQLGQVGAYLEKMGVKDRLEKDGRFDIIDNWDSLMGLLEETNNYSLESTPKNNEVSDYFLNAEKTLPANKDFKFNKDERDLLYGSTLMSGAVSSGAAFATYFSEKFAVNINTDMIFQHITPEQVQTAAESTGTPVELLLAGAIVVPAVVYAGLKKGIKWYKNRGIKKDYSEFPSFDQVFDTFGDKTGDAYVHIFETYKTMIDGSGTL